MAAGVLAAPGTPAGPCENECLHVDCSETRLMAAQSCAYCGKAIGYGTRFYRTDGLVPITGERIYVHALCEERRAE